MIDEKIKTVDTSSTIHELKMRKTKLLSPYPGNARKHSDKQIKMLMASIQEFGFNQPILVDEKLIVLAGHGRLEAARQLGLITVPTIKITGLSNQKKQAYVIADNKIAEQSEWDIQKLSAQFEELLKCEFEIELTGFSTAEIDNLLDPVAITENHDADDLQTSDLNVPAISKLGDHWILGRHHLYCGSALEHESYSRLMGDKSAQMIFTDPPYNVLIDGHARGKGKSKHENFIMASGEMSSKEFTQFLSSAMKCMHEFSHDGSIHYICMDWRHMDEMSKASQPIYGPLKQLIVWNKDNGGMGAYYRNKHELIFIYKKGKAPHINNFGLGEKGRYRTNVWDYPGVNTMKKGRKEELSMHPTVKPVSLVADAIRDCSHRKGIILDPFCGSGTTIMAAERTGRTAYCLELDPKYVDVAIHRFMRIHNKPVILAKNGKTYQEVVANRSSLKKSEQV